MRIILSIAATTKLSLRKYDVSNTYLYSKIDKEIYIDIPQGHKGNHQKGDVLQKEGFIWIKAVWSIME